MNITYDKNRRRNAIEIVLTVTEWAGGEDDPLHLVRNEDGEWGHVVHSFIDAKRDAFDDDPEAFAAAREGNQ